MFTCVRRWTVPNVPPSLIALLVTCRLIDVHARPSMAAVTVVPPRHLHVQRKRDEHLERRHRLRKVRHHARARAAVVHTGPETVVLFVLHRLRTRLLVELKTLVLIIALQTLLSETFVVLLSLAVPVVVPRPLRLVPVLHPQTLLVLRRLLALLLIVTPEVFRLHVVPSLTLSPCYHHFCQLPTGTWLLGQLASPLSWTVAHRSVL
jgi:hypothetical protein